MGRNAGIWIACLVLTGSLAVWSQADGYRISSLSDDLLNVAYNSADPSGGGDDGAGRSEGGDDGAGSSSSSSAGSSKGSSSCNTASFSRCETEIASSEMVFSSG